MPAHSIAGFTITANVPPATGTCTGTSTLLNSATVTSSTADPSGSNNIGQHSVTATCPPHRSSRDQGVYQSTVERGQDVSYTITVENLGNIPAQNVNVTDVLPAGMTYVTNTSNVTCSGTNVVICQVGTVNPGSPVTFGLVAHIPAPPAPARAL